MEFFLIDRANLKWQSDNHVDVGTKEEGDLCDARAPCQESASACCDLHRIAVATLGRFYPLQSFRRRW